MSLCSSHATCLYLCQQKALPETVPILYQLDNYFVMQWTSKLPYCTDCTTKPVQNSQKLLALGRPLTQQCLSIIMYYFFPTYNCTLSPSVQNCESLCSFKQTVLAMSHVHQISHLNKFIQVYQGVLLSQQIAIYVPCIIAIKN